MAEFASPQRTLPDARSNPPQARAVFHLPAPGLGAGPPVGIVRVEGEFGRWALDHLKELVPAFFDPETRAFRQLSHATVRGLLAQDCAIDTSSFVSPARR